MLIVAETKVEGAIWNECPTVNGPQSKGPAGPDTLSYQIGVDEDAVTKTDVLIERKFVPVIVAVAHGLM